LVDDIGSIVFPFILLFICITSINGEGKVYEIISFFSLASFPVRPGKTRCQKEIL
jgi:hypothetical protein